MLGIEQRTWLTSMKPSETIQLSGERQPINKPINRIISEHDKCYDAL